MTLALIAAYWTWQWLAPLPQSRAPAVKINDSGTAAAGLFGTSIPTSGGIPPTAIAIRLLGLVAATAGHSGYAVLQLDPHAVLTVREGDEIAPGLRLAQVGVDHVILTRSGVHETLAWPQKTTPTALAPPTNQQ